RSRAQPRSRRDTYFGARPILSRCCGSSIVCTTRNCSSLITKDQSSIRWRCRPHRRRRSIPSSSTFIMRTEGGDEPSMTPPNSSWTTLVWARPPRVHEEDSGVGSVESSDHLVREKLVGRRNRTAYLCYPITAF